MDLEQLGSLIRLVNDLESVCEEGGVPEEAILATHVLGIAMRIHAQPEGEREGMYSDLEADVREHVEALNTLERTASERTGLSVEALRAGVLGV